VKAEGQTQTLQFRITKVCIDSLAIESDGFNPPCISFIITTKNFYSGKKTLFLDTTSKSDLGFGRLVYYDAGKREYYYSLIEPLIGYWDNISGNSFEVEKNASADLVAVISLSAIFHYYKSEGKANNYKGEMFTNLVKTGRFFYVPGEYSKKEEKTVKLPKGAIEIHINRGLEIVYNNSCLRYP
jgi:hypothetical protein